MCRIIVCLYIKVHGVYCHPDISTPRPRSAALQTDVPRARLGDHGKAREAHLLRPGRLAPLHLQVVQEQHAPPRGPQQVPRLQELLVYGRPQDRQFGQCKGGENVVLSFIFSTKPVHQTGVCIKLNEWDFIFPCRSLSVFLFYYLDLFWVCE